MTATERQTLKRIRDEADQLLAACAAEQGKCDALEARIDRLFGDPRSDGNALGESLKVAGKVTSGLAAIAGDVAVIRLAAAVRLLEGGGDE